MPPKIIENGKAILVEGRDAERFIVQACQSMGIEDFYVYDFGGISQLGDYLKLFRLATGFENVTSLIVVRDAEGNANGAIQSISGHLSAADLPAPMVPFSFIGNELKVAMAIFPGSYELVGENLNYNNGTLEDLCCSMLSDDTRLEFANDCVGQYERIFQALRWRHKSLLHLFFSINDSYVGKKIGEASLCGAFNWGSDAFQNFRQLIEDME